MAHYLLVIALSLIAVAAAKAETTITTETTLCDEARVFESIAIGRKGPSATHLEIARDVDCDNHEDYGAWRLEIVDEVVEPGHSPARVGTAIRSDQNCPGLENQMHKLHWPPPRATLKWQPQQAGRFSIQDFGGLFELRSQVDRRTAERWVRETLILVRPCLDLGSDDDSQRLVDRFYAESGLRRH